MVNHTNPDEEDTKISQIAIQKEKVSEERWLGCDQQVK